MKALRIAALILACAAALGGGMLLSALLFDRPTPELPTIQGYVLERPRTPVPFSLTDERGATFERDDFRDRWSFLYFGYTYCPDICPLTLAVFAQLKKELAQQQPAVPTDFFLVSVDPARDTPERLRDYVKWFDPQFRAITGDFAELDKLARAAGVLYVVPDDTEGGEYLVDHSSTVVLINPDGAVHAVFSSPHTAERMAADFARITRSGS